MRMIVADKPAEMWDVRYKLPVVRSYEQEGKAHEYTHYQHFGVKCVAMTAADACALVLQYRPKAIVLGVHHRSGGDESRVLIDRNLLTEMWITSNEARAVERGMRRMIEDRDSLPDGCERRILTVDIETVKTLLERIG